MPSSPWISPYSPCSSGPVVLWPQLLHKSFFIPLLKSCPALSAVIRIVLDSRRECEWFTALPALSAHDLRNTILFPVFLFATGTIVWNVFPWRIIRDRRPARPAGFCPKPWPFILYLRCFRFEEQFFQPVKHLLPPTKQLEFLMFVIPDRGYNGDCGVNHVRDYQLAAIIRPFSRNWLLFYCASFRLLNDRIRRQLRNESSQADHEEDPVSIFPYLFLKLFPLLFLLWETVGRFRSHYVL